MIQQRINALSRRSLVIYWKVNKMYLKNKRCTIWKAEWILQKGFNDLLIAGWKHFKERKLYIDFVTWTSPIVVHIFGQNWYLVVLVILACLGHTWCLKALFSRTFATWAKRKSLMFFSELSIINTQNVSSHSAISIEISGTLILQWWPTLQFNMTKAERTHNPRRLCFPLSSLSVQIKSLDAKGEINHMCKIDKYILAFLTNIVHPS